MKQKPQGPFRVDGSKVVQSVRHIRQFADSSEIITKSPNRRQADSTCSSSAYCLIDSNERLSEHTDYLQSNALNC
jgi:hypothetical protein